jgi:hypothetical protein
MQGVSIYVHHQQVWPPTGCIYLNHQQSGRLQGVSMGVSIYTTSSVDVQGVSLSTVSSVDEHLCNVHPLSPSQFF